MAFPGNCDTRVYGITTSAGCSLTRPTIQGFTPQDFEDQGYKEVDMAGIIGQAQEAKLGGYKENTLDALIYGAMKPVKSELSTSNLPDQKSVIMPYFYKQQRTQINANTWKVESGTANPNAGLGAVHPGSWQFTIVNSGSRWGTTLPSLERYFLPGMYLKVFSVGTANAAVEAAYKITASANADSGGVYKTVVTVEPNYTATGWASLTTAQKLVWQATSGVAVIMANSVSNFESYNQENMAEQSRNLLTFWLQTSRETYEYSTEYLKALNAPLTSQYYKKYLSMPLAEQRKLKQEKWMKAWRYSLFYGERINEKQTVERDGWQNLPTVVDPANPSCPLEYKSNALGFKTMLSDCSRVYDYANANLNLDTVFQQSYDLKRAREVEGGMVDTVDWMCDPWTAGRFHLAMQDYYRSRGLDFKDYYTSNTPMEMNNLFNLTSNVYQLPPEKGGINIAIFPNDYFRDWRTAHAAAGQRNRGSMMWGIDWSDFGVGIAGRRRVQRKTNLADNLYNTVIDVNVHHYDLVSTTWTVMFDNANRHYLFDNFDTTTPTFTHNDIE